ncbi:hypothetical protein AD930_07670 [Acetobacter malorum]|nr:hypothetical protein AD930_07670 [Acetobacter malorum]
MIVRGLISLRQNNWIILPSLRKQMALEQYRVHTRPYRRHIFLQQQFEVQILIQGVSSSDGKEGARG